MSTDAIWSTRCESIRTCLHFVSMYVGVAGYHEFFFFESRAWGASMVCLYAHVGNRAQDIHHVKVAAALVSTRQDQSWLRAIETSWQMTKKPPATLQTKSWLNVYIYCNSDRADRLKRSSRAPRCNFRPISGFPSLATRVGSGDLQRSFVHKGKLTCRQNLAGEGCVGEQGKDGGGWQGSRLCSVAA